MNPTMISAQKTLSNVAELVGGTLQGDATVPITGLASATEAEPGSLVFAENARYIEIALRSKAAAVLVPTEALALLSAPPKPLIGVANPRFAFVQLLEAWQPAPTFAPGIHSTAMLGSDVTLGEGVHIGAHVTVGDGVTLGEGVALLAGVKVGAGCHIGAGTVLHPNVVLYPEVQVGRNCVLHAGCVIGADGFGFIPIGQTLRKVPHLGTVEIGDDVEIGANSCVDRARTGATVIGSGSKLDNLVHVAHNVQIGMGSILVAQTGIAGSTRIGNGVILGGQAGIKDHITIGDGARVGAQGGVIGDVKPGETVSGYPARPHADKMREYAAAAALPKMTKRLRELEARLAALEAQLSHKTD